MIPESEYRTHDNGIRYVTIQEVEDHHGIAGAAQFESWMANQTVLMTTDGVGYFVHDYERWVKGLPVED